jgi:hypothetical protein
MTSRRATTFSWRISRLSCHKTISAILFIVRDSAYRDLSYSTLTDTGVGKDLALFLGFELLDSIELSSCMGFVHPPVRPTRDEAHDVVFRFYRGAGVVFPGAVGSHEVLRRCGHGLEEGQASRHPKKQAPRSCRVKVTRVTACSLPARRTGKGHSVAMEDVLFLNTLKTTVLQPKVGRTMVVGAYHK